MSAGQSLMKSRFCPGMAAWMIPLQRAEERGLKADPTKCIYDNRNGRRRIAASISGHPSLAAINFGRVEFVIFA